LLRGQLGELECFAKILDSGLKVVELLFKIHRSRCRGGMRIQLIAAVNRLRRFNARLRSIDIRHREGAIQGNNRRVIELQQLIVQGENLSPIG
jgi:hypothetical protein